MREVGRERGGWGWERGWDEGLRSAGEEEEEDGTSGMWGSGETRASPLLCGREPLASTSRGNQFDGASPELAAPTAQPTSSSSTSSLLAPSHVTLVPATLHPSTLLPSPLLSPAQTGKRARSVPPHTAAGPTPRPPPLQTAVRPPAASRERRAAMTRALQRSVKGLLGPGGVVVPFAEGDARLGGRACLSFSERVRTDENGMSGESGEREEETWGSFKTVPPTPEQLRRK